MRPVLAYLLAPLAGLLLFAVIWSLPLLPYGGTGPVALGKVWSMALGIVVPAFVVVLALSLGVMFWVRARFGGAWWAALAGGVGLYLVAFALLAGRFGFATVFANPYWLGGLLAGGVLHGAVFRAVVGPGRAARHA